ncbi:GCN5-related N-acetyltransferase [Caldicellulosiruptor owensensis OL]|uniref:GCN5-related N-acetyltransferase n=1 Tax=Caldicellulosiruptor owensensis (strain ATCC 700167 / DSM 13100 / OL) TaxID=632518 RepID=E4Q3G7_CALOW|nr:GNAT family N-acetyltransferase [Caldicellulosiruptor owensensis]ADQ03927.1 GCN5-related N-acetyltransferase [Caldicellulosiruptor owensensis OL]
MIRKLSSSDYDVLMDFVRKEKEWNIFIIGDVVSYGFDSPVVEVWGEFDIVFGSLKAVLLRYRRDLIFYSDSEDYDIDSFCNIILTTKCKVLSGKKTVILPFLKALNVLQKREQFFMRLDTNIPKEKIEPSLEEYERVKVISKDNLEENLDKIEMIVYLYQSIEEFLNPATFEQIKQDVSLGRSRIYYIEEDGIIVSSARTGAELPDMAMVLSVCTMHEYRSKGYATMCMKRLCSDLIKEDKSLCLFCDNPKAANIYKKIGFQQIGTWVTLGL